MKILVFGSTGMAGHTIALYFKEKGYDITAYNRVQSDICPTIEGNIYEKNRIIELIAKEQYNAVINCIGLLNQTAENNKAEAVYVNSYFPHMLAEITSDTKTKLMHMSTDCVFSGKTGGYDEKSIPDGQTFYDRTKALGEVVDDKNLTFRCSIIGPDTKQNGIGLFNWFMKQQGSINGYKKALWTGVTTLTLAKAMEQAIQQNLCGLYNLVNNAFINKCDLCGLFNKHFKHNSIKIIPTEDVVLNKSLVNTRRDFNFVVPSYEEMIVQMKEWVIEHQHLYQHYDLKY